MNIATLAVVRASVDTTIIDIVNRGGAIRYRVTKNGRVIGETASKSAAYDLAYPTEVL